ncbi:MAG: hypothetical protein ACTSPD_21145 [Promethearchaeota archaeon]
MLQINEYLNQDQFFPEKKKYIQPFEESSSLQNNYVIKISKNFIVTPISKEGISISEKIKAHSDEIKEIIKKLNDFFEIDLDFDFNTNFIYEDIKKKNATIEKLEDMNFSKVFEDDF